MVVLRLRLGDVSVYLVLLDRNMDMHYYVDILDKNLIQSGNHLRLDRHFISQQGNDPKHTLGLAKAWLKKNKIELLPWASFSPDMESIEHLWDEFDRRVKKRQPTSKSDLQRVLLDGWNGIGRDVTEKLVGSVPNRFYESIKQKGHPTDYLKMRFSEKCNSYMRGRSILSNKTTLSFCFVLNKIRTTYNFDPKISTQLEQSMVYILHKCRKWDLIWF